MRALHDNTAAGSYCALWQATVLPPSQVGAMGLIDNDGNLFPLTNIGKASDIRRQPEIIGIGENCGLDGFSGNQFTDLCRCRRQPMAKAWTKGLFNPYGHCPAVYKSSQHRFVTVSLHQHAISRSGQSGDCGHYAHTAAVYKKICFGSTVYVCHQVLGPPEDIPGTVQVVQTRQFSRIKLAE